MTSFSRVLVTGAAGNLGGKLIAALERAPWCEAVVAVDQGPGHVSDRVTWVTGDMRQRGQAWSAALAEVDAVVHLAAQHPYPDASWADSAASFDMTANLIEAAVEHGINRLVFASSNHVMGGYKDTDVALTPGGLGTDLPPLVGTTWRQGDATLNSAAYASAKLMGERLCTARAGPFTSVSVRIGWCQPGVNMPDTLSATGKPKSVGAIDGGDRDLRWFQDMWLSNLDFEAVMLAAITAGAAHWPAPAIVVNGMSRNHDMPWDLASAATLIDYRPRDDVRFYAPRYA